jgi:hypothetical protein
MAHYRNALPQSAGGLFLTDGGIETTLIFHEGLELPDFAAFCCALRKAKRPCTSTSVSVHLCDQAMQWGE